MKKTRMGRANLEKKSRSGFGRKNFGFLSNFVHPCLKNLQNLLSKIFFFFFYKIFLVNKEALNYDLIAIGFEEIVDLNTNNLVKASTTNQRIWRDGLKQTIEIWQKNNFGSNAENFVVLCCEQLVGLGVFC